MSTTQREDGGEDYFVGRRALFHTGAVLAGAAGLGVVGAGLAASPATAADGDSLAVGVPNAGESTTGLTIGDTTGSTSPALALTNQNGPALSLTPLAADWDEPLQVGEIANTTRGPVIGIAKGAGAINTPLLTEQDVWLPFVLPTPMRLVDTRTEEGRQRVALPSPLDGEGRLPANTELTIWIAPVNDDFTIQAVYLNLTIVRPAARGWAQAYPGPDRPVDPPTSTVNFVRGQTLANAAFIGTSVGTNRTQFDDPNQPPVESYFIKVYTTAPAWIVIDGTGGFSTGRSPLANPNDQQQRSPAALAQRRFGKIPK